MNGIVIHIHVNAKYGPLRIAIVDLVDSDLDGYKWHSNNDGYVRSSSFTDGRQRYMSIHRLIMSRILGRSLSKDEIVDHIDRDILNNCRSNLRIATAAQNNQNIGLTCANTSGYKGVSFNKARGLWSASICAHNKTYRLGHFETKEEAARAYNAAALELHGEFAYQNIIPEANETHG